MSDTNNHLRRHELLSSRKLEATIMKKLYERKGHLNSFSIKNVYLTLLIGILLMVFTTFLFSHGSAIVHPPKLTPPKDEIAKALEFINDLKNHSTTTNQLKQDLKIDKTVKHTTSNEYTPQSQITQIKQKLYQVLQIVLHLNLSTRTSTN